MTNRQLLSWAQRLVLGCAGLLCAGTSVADSVANASPESDPAMTADVDQGAQNIDLQRFMGRWYVIASIPTMFERDAFNATEDYEWRGDGKVATTFTYNKGSLDGPRKVSRPTGFVSSENPAIWKMQFLWPFKADYRVLYVDDDHTVTIIGRKKRDYVWLMAREAIMDEVVFADYRDQIAQYGYDIGELERISHRASDP